jgi:anti-sigma B factor antagonist
MQLNITVTKKGEGIFVISPAGSVDSDTYMALEEKVESVLISKPKAVIFDMKDVSYISSSGLGVIFGVKRALEKEQGKLYIVNLTPPVKKVFDIVNALPEQNLFASVEELDNYLDKMQRENTC